ncbi:tyrosine-type recombinase/integrase [Lactococcus garvieae]|uniref:tyrosine-type recombinase/integrase n=1 Tax=Lactococcus garvieae TaxID=1363 RepID=UPI0030D1F332
MWIEELENGKFKYCERYTDLDGKTRKVAVTLEKNSTRAQNEAARLLYNKIEAKKEKQAQENDTSSITFWEIQDKFLDISKETIKIRTNASRQSAKLKIREHIPKETLLNEVTAPFISSILEQLYYKENYSYSYIVSIKSGINLVLDYAVSKEYIENNPMAKVKIKKKIETLEQREKKRNKYLEQDELKNVIKQMEVIDKPTALLIEFMALTGLRFGECVGIQFKDIQDDTLHVSGSYDPVSQTKTTTKNIYSDRKISLSNRSCEILFEMIENNKLFRPSREKPNSYVFTSKSGKPFDLKTIGERLTKITIDKKLTTHVFRHTHIALLTELGIPLKAIMERVGHNNPNTTLSIYSHVTDKMSKNITSKLNEIDLHN